MVTNGTYSAPVRRAGYRVVALGAALSVALAFALALITPHGVFVGTWTFYAEVVCHRDGVYIGAQRGPRSSGGVGYDIGNSLTSWHYLSRVGGSHTRQLPGVRWSSAPFFLFILFVPWWVVGGLVALLWVPLALRIRRGAATAGVCRACGYDLRATPSRCPECGTVIAAPPATTDAAAFRAALWCAGVAASLTAMDIFLGPRGRLPPYAELVYAASFIASLALLADGYLLARRLRGHGAWALALLLFSMVRVLLPRLVS